MQPLSPDKEEELVRKAHSGDRKAMGTLLRHFGPIVYRTVLLPRLGSVSAAEEALSETYARVVSRIAQFSWQGVGFYPWFRTCALHVALDALRKKKRLSLWEPDDVERELDRTATTTPLDERLSTASDTAEAKRRVEEALLRINPRYAQAIRMRVLEEKPREEAARILGVSPATFDVVLHRATTALRRALESTPPLPAIKEVQHGS